MSRPARTSNANQERTLSPLQIEILKLTYKFRYVTIPLISRHQNKSKVTISQSINSLLAKDYLDRRYSNKYKLAGRPAEYFLNKKGIRYLRDNFSLNENVLHSMYKNKSIGEPFVDKCLLIYQIYIDLQSRYGDSYTIVTKSETAGYDVFPTPHPDLYMFNENGDVIIDIFTENVFIPVKKRLIQLLNFDQDEEWPMTTPPTILFLFLNNRIKEKADQAVLNLEGELDIKIDCALITLERV